MPARALKPKDKSLVEGAVNITYTRIYAALRDKELRYYGIEFGYTGASFDLQSNPFSEKRTQSYRSFFRNRAGCFKAIAFGEIRTERL
jgi:hypothetical protein